MSFVIKINRRACEKRIHTNFFPLRFPTWILSIMTSERRHQHSISIYLFTWVYRWKSAQSFDFIFIFIWYMYDRVWMYQLWVLLTHDYSSISIWNVRWYSIDHSLAFVFRYFCGVYKQITCAEFNWNVVFLDRKKKERENLEEWGREKRRKG